MFSPGLIHTLRAQTGAGVMACRRALIACDMNLTRAAAMIAESRDGTARNKPTGARRIEAYVHHDGASGALIELATESDFVARTDEIRGLARELALQAVALAAAGTRDTPLTPEALLASVSVRDGRQTLAQLVADVAGRVGETVRITRVAVL